MFECTPAHYGWDSFITIGRYSDLGTVTYIYAGLNILTDIYVLVVPLPAVWSLPLSAGQKFRIIAVFGLGVW
jgi:hypothetical protein